MSTYYLGIDIGSVGSKAVIIDESGKILTSSVVSSGTNYSTTAAAIKEDVLSKAGLKPADIKASGSTGTGGRNAVADN